MLKSRKNRLFRINLLLGIVTLTATAIGGGMSTNHSLLTNETLKALVSRMTSDIPTDRQIVPMLGKLINNWGDYSLEIRPQFSNVKTIEAFFEEDEITLNLNGIVKLPLAGLIEQFGQPMQPPLGTHGERRVIFMSSKGKNACRLVASIPRSVTLAKAAVQTLAIKCTYGLE